MKLYIAQIDRLINAEENKRKTDAGNTGAQKPDRDAESSVANALLHRVCAQYGTMFMHLPSGKPVSSDESLHISASHDDGWIVAGWTLRSSIGVDFVSWSQYSPVLRVLLSPDEYALLHNNNERKIVCNAWSVREAFLKCMGCGLSVHPRVLDVRRAPEKVKSTFSYDGRVVSSQLWRISYHKIWNMWAYANVFAFHNGFSVAVASQDIETITRIEISSCSQLEF